MKLHRKAAFWAATTSVFIAGAVYVVMRSERVQFAETVSCLKGLTPVSGAPHIMSWDLSRAGGPVIHNKSFVSTFIVDKPFSELNTELKAELKPRAFTASSYPSKRPSMTTYGFWVNGNKESVVMTLNADGVRTTKVTLHEPQTLSLFDRMQLWMDGFRGKKRKPSNPGQVFLVRKSP